MVGPVSDCTVLSFFSCECTSTLFRFSSVSVHAFLLTSDFASALELVQSALNLSHPSFYSSVPCEHLGTPSIYSVFGDFSTALILQSDIRCFFEGS